MVWAIKIFRPYLYGRRFTIVTDHAALKWLMTRREPSGRLHRWALMLQEYDFQVQFRPGHENVVPDALSRAPVRLAAAANQLTMSVIARDQEDSQICQQLAASGSWEGRLVQKVDGVLCIGKGDDRRIILPAALWAVALKESHDSI